MRPRAYACTCARARMYLRTCARRSGCMVLILLKINTILPSYHLDGKPSYHLDGIPSYHLDGIPSYHLDGIPSKIYIFEHLRTFWSFFKILHICGSRYISKSFLIFSFFAPSYHLDGIPSYHHTILMVKILHYLILKSGVNHPRVVSFSVEEHRKFLKILSQFLSEL